MVLPDGSGFAIPLGRRDGGFVGEFAVVSPEDKELSEFRWRRNYHGHADRREGSRANLRTFRMHRAVYERMHGDAPECIDHVNRDQLDNRRENLRAATHAENSQNLTPRRGAKSDHRGVSFKNDGRARPWKAEHMVAGVRHFLGYFATEEEAAEAALAFRREHMPFSTD